MLRVLEEDFARIPELLEQSLATAPEGDEPEEAVLEQDPESVQLGLF